MGRNSPHPLGLLRLNPQKALRTAAGTHHTPSACWPPLSSLLNSITVLPPTLSSRVSRPQSPDAEVVLDCDHSGITPRLVTVPCPVGSIFVIRPLIFTISLFFPCKHARSSHHQLLLGLIFLLLFPSPLPNPIIHYSHSRVTFC